MENHANLVSMEASRITHTRVYKPPRLDAQARPDWPLEIMGISAEVAGEAETGLPSCKLS